MIMNDAEVDAGAGDAPVRQPGRRAFLSGSAAALGALALAGCTTGGMSFAEAARVYGPLPGERFPVPAADISKVDPKYLRRTVRYASNEAVGTIIVDPAALSGGSVEFVAQAATIDTRNERRDGHLKSAEFFDVEKFPTITFKSTKVVATGNTMKITGDLTIKGITKSIVLDAEFLGATGPAEPGKQKAGFHASAKINRLDWGVTWNRAAEGGGLTLGDKVELDFNIEAVRT